MNHFRLFKKNFDFQNYFCFAYFVVVIFCIFNINYKIYSISIPYEQVTKDYDKQGLVCSIEEKQRRLEDSLNNFFNFEEIQQIFQQKTIDQILTQEHNVLKKALFKDFINKIISQAKTETSSQISEVLKEICFLQSSEKEKQIKNPKKLDSLKEKLSNLIISIHGDDIRREYFLYILNSYKDEYPPSNNFRNLENLKRTQMFSHFKEPTNLQFKIEYLRICYKKLEDVQNLFLELNYKIQSEEFLNTIFNLRTDNLEDVTETLYCNEEEKKQLSKEFSSFSEPILNSCLFSDQAPNAKIIQDIIASQMSTLINRIAEQKEIHLDLETDIFLKEGIWKELEVLPSPNDFKNFEISFKEEIINPDLYKKELINSIESEIKNLNQNFLEVLKVFDSNLKKLNNKYYLMIFQVSCLLVQGEHTTKEIPTKDQIRNFLLQKNKLFEIIFSFFINKILERYKSIIKEFEYYKKCLDSELQSQIKDIQKSYELKEDPSYIFLADPLFLQKELKKDLEKIQIQTQKIIYFLYSNYFCKNITDGTRANILNQLQKNDHGKLLENSFKNFIELYLNKICSLKFEYQKKKTDLETYQKCCDEKKEKYLEPINSRLDSLLKQFQDQLVSPYQDPNAKNNFEFSLNNLEWIKQFVSSYQETLSAKFESFKIVDYTNDDDHKLWLEQLEKINSTIIEKFENNKKPENIHNYSFQDINNFILSQEKIISKNKNLLLLKDKHKDIEEKKTQLNKFCDEKTQQILITIHGKIKKLLEQIKKQRKEVNNKSSIEIKQKNIEKEKEKLENEIKDLKNDLKNREKSLEEIKKQRAEVNNKSSIEIKQKNIEKEQLENEIKDLKKLEKAKNDKKTNIENEKIPELIKKLEESQKKIETIIGTFEKEKEKFVFDFDQIVQNYFIIDLPDIIKDKNKSSSISQRNSF